VSVLGGDQLTALHIDGTRDLLRQVPGVSLVASGPEFQQEISMRGQGAGRNGFSETSTGLYENGSYMAGGGFNGRQLTELNLFDANRIEILHGPQGALYGRNSVGGAVNVIVNEPAPDFSAMENVQYGSLESWGAKGIVDAPVNLGGLEIDTRLGGFYDKQDEGFNKNLVTGHFLDRDFHVGARAGFEVKPTADSKLYVQIEYFDEREPSFGTLGYVPVYAATTSAFTKGATLDPGPYTRDHLSREGADHTPEVTEYVGFDDSLSFADLSVKFYNRNRSANRSNEDYDHFIGLPGFASIGTGGVKAPVDLAQGQAENFHLYDTQVTLTSHGDGAWKWLVGFEMLDFVDNVTQGFENCATYNPAAKTAAQMATYEQNGGGGCVTGVAPAAASYGVPALFTADTTILNTIRALVNTTLSRNEITSYAGFATLSYDFNSQWTIGVGARLTADKNDYTAVQYSQDPLTYWGAGAAPAGFLKPLAGMFCSPTIEAAGQCAGGTGPFQSGALSGTWDEVLPTATLTYKVTDAQTLYLRFATGYRPGGFNNPLQAVQAAYSPEYTQSGEFGWKGSLFGLIDGDADVYYQQTHNVQLVQYSQATSGGFVLQNVGSDHVYGVEANINRDFKNIGPGDFRVALSLSSDTGTFAPGVKISEKAPFGPVSLAGLRVPFTFDIQGALDGTYTMPVWGDYTAQLEVNYQFSSGGVWNYSGAGGILTTTDNPTANSVDLHFNLISSKGWEFTAFGQNILDYRYKLAAVSGAQFWSQGATWGIAITAHQ
jgi:outer membrane receptor protein involved in Fe transport